MKPTKGYKRVYLITGLLLLILGLFVSAFLYSRWGGKWASSLVLPIPPSSNVVEETVFVNGSYWMRLRIYDVNLELQNARLWFTENGIPMSPLDSELSSDDRSYYSLPIIGTGSWQYELLYTTAFLSGVRKLNSYETSATCFRVYIYDSLEAVDFPNFQIHFPDLDATSFNGNSLILVQSCWTQW